MGAFKEKKGLGEVGKGWDWRAKELQELFSKAVREVAQSRGVAIFVDALDETGSETGTEIVSFFHSLNDALATDRDSSAKICISCRHYPVVARRPGLEIIAEEENHRDIWRFVHWRLTNEVQHRPDDPLHEKGIIELGAALVEKAGDSFQWISLMILRVIRMLNDGESFEDVSDMISEQSNDLFAFYENILKSVINPRKRGRTLLLMQWVCFADRPLSVSELRFALACDTKWFSPTSSVVRKAKVLWSRMAE